MADVFLTLAHGLQGVNKLSVVKRLRNGEDLALTEMFLNEARLAARLNHPNVVHTYEVGEAHGEYFIAMEYLEGQPLSRLLKTLEDRCEGLPEPLVAFIAIQALKGLHHAHEFCDFDGAPLEIVHRDVSPHNLFVTYSGEIKLLDFGIAKATLNSNQTEDGVLKGKVRYMAPEQATQRDLDRRVDIYAFGVVLWEMLARRGLFTGPPLSILTRIMNEEIPPVRGVRPDVSPALEAIALKAVRRERGERYATAEQMQLDLEAYLNERRDGVSERDLARMMNEMFAAIRDDVRAKIKAYISTMPVQRGLLPGSTGITSTGKLPVLPTWSSPPSSPSWPAASSPEEPGERPPRASPRASQGARRSRRLPGFLVALFFVAAAAAGLLFVESPGHPIVESSAPSSAPSASAALPVLATARVASATAPVAAPAASIVASSLSSSAAPADARPVESGSAPPTAVPASSGSPRGSHHGHVHSPAPPPVTPAAVTPAAPAPAPAPAPPPAPDRPKVRMLDDSEAQ
jgi:serine/threonine protein kinase